MRTYGVTRWLGTWAARALSMLLAMAALTAACGDDDAAGGDAGGESGAHADHDGGDPGDSGGGHAGDGLAGAGGSGADGGVAHGDAGGSGTGGDDGGMMSCNCPSGSACLVVTCSPAGSCEEQNVDDGEPIDDQTAGDCNQVVCDGEGDTRNEPEAEGTECDVDDGVMCDGDGHCVECVDEGDCDGSDVCQSGSCVPETCMNEDQDGDETDEDCGGADCAPCGPDKACIDDEDCAGDDCTSLSCVPNCEDGVQNDDEAAVDCGEGCSAGCALGTPCDEEADCASGLCDSGSDLCASAGDCFDDTPNGDETDEDCGGPDCDPCGPDLMCVDDDDCAGGDCGDEDTCVPNCSDEEQNNDEVDVDCGPGCGTCGNDRDCSEDEHCTSGICIDGTCGLNGCTVANTMDRTGMGTTTIAASSFMYTPPCIEVSAGTVVTVTGSSGTHPFTGGRIVAGAKQAASSGPFMGMFTDATEMFTMSNAGSFPFYCNNHGLSSGMKGAVFVVP